MEEQHEPILNFCTYFIELLKQEENTKAYMHLLSILEFAIQFLGPEGKAAYKHLIDEIFLDYENVIFEDAADFSNFFKERTQRLYE